VPVKEPVVKEVFKDSAETLGKLDKCESDLSKANSELEKVNSELSEAKAKLDKHAEAILEDMKESATLVLVEDYLNDDDFKDELINQIESLGYDIEDKESDVVLVKVMDREVDLDDESELDDLDGTVSVELKVKFVDDGDKVHTEYFDVEFEVEDSEVVDFNF
jgi:predicted nucleotide-binding protein (sugar kinase/HSP70/actin superfamily)